MHATQKYRWLVDAVLFAGFILAFFLDLTGLTFHQWLGLGVAALAAYHLFDHDTWLTSVTRRFFGRISSRSRLYYLLDAALLFGFATITATGLVISSWLNLQLANFDAWLTIHITASIFTLLVTVLKLALHWRWIVLVAESIFSAQPVLPSCPAAGTAPLGRREFVRLMGVVGVGSIIALANSLDRLRSSENAQSTTSTANTNTASIFQPAASTSSTNCFVRCQKRCAFPGRCRKYVDANNSGRCDLGECA